MKLEKYLESLPQKIISGEDVQLPDKSFRDIFKFANLNENDVFYHLGCGDGKGISIALEEFNVGKAIGIDNNAKKIGLADRMLKEKNLAKGSVVCQDILESNFEDATVILFWFTEPATIEKMMKKFQTLKPPSKIITIWGPLPGCLPYEVDFPYIINQIPLKKAKDLREQVLSIFGVKCVDFVTAWEFAERYTKAIGSQEAGNDRFLTILQSLVIWISAKNLGVACGDEIPPPIKAYMGILREFFNIEVEHLIK